MLGIMLTAGVWEDVTDIVSQVGFPIAMCAALFWKINDQDNKHQKEMEAVTEALNNNTLAMQKLVDKLEDGR